MSDFVAKVKDLLSRINPEDPNAVRVLSRRSNPRQEGRSARRINSLARVMPFCETYLEVGVAQGLTLEQVQVRSKIGVDPTPQFETLKLPKGVSFYQESSDTFFENLESEVLFDLIFLDGLHEWKQTYKDLINALHHSKPTSIILVDDVIPDDKLAAYPDWDKALKLKDAAGITDGRWQGDVFKVLIAVKEFHPELVYCVIGEHDKVDNPQAIVWTMDGVDPRKIRAATDAKLLEIDKLSYSDVFNGSILPRVFSLTPESEGIKRALRARADRRV